MQTSDAIFVFAGEKGRKLFGISLFEQGTAPRLLLSTGRFELRRFPELPIVPKPDLIEIAKPIPPPKRHCIVVYPGGEVIWVRRGRLGTLTEIMALREWLIANPQVRQLTIVSSDYHLPRIRFCCERLLPAVKIDYVASPPGSRELNVRIKEPAKRLLYRAVVVIRGLID